jgi:ketosteroid isomerase-like protein
MDGKELVIRRLYDARAHRDWDAVHALLADEVDWHEPGDVDHSGSPRGREVVVSLLQNYVEVTEGTFQLEPEAFLNLAEHSAVAVRWWAERNGQRSEGREIAVYHLCGGAIDHVWFYNEPSDAEALAAVFAFD